MKIKKMIALVLALTLLLTLVPNAAAEESTYTLSVSVGDQNLPLRVRNVNGDWYAEINDLAALGGNKASINLEMKKASLYKTEADTGDIICILYSVDDSVYVESGGSYYVPLQAASVASGVHFYRTDPLKAEALRTPMQLLEEMEDIYYDQRYQITQLLLTDGYALTESFAKVYAMLPFVGSGSFLGTVTGSDKTDRYRNAMTAILTNDGEFSDFIDQSADLCSDVHEAADILKMVKELTAKDGKLYELLLSKGMDAQILDAMAYEQDPYDSLDGLFEGWSDALAAVDFSYYLELCSFYAAGIDTEESIVLAMERAFKDSDDAYSREAAAKILDQRYGTGFKGATDIYGGVIWNLTVNYLNEQAEKMLYGGYASAVGLVGKGIDFVFQASDKSEAYIYFPIFASIQQDLCGYFIGHRYDTEEHTMYDLRAVTIMYLKAAISAYAYAAFDKSLADTLEKAAGILNAELANVLSYSESEYAPDYDNRNIIDLLNSGNLPLEEPVPDDGEWPTAQELFDETVWAMDYGQSLGFQYSALFSTDGTFLAYGHGSGEYSNGTYTYDPTTGRLTVTFNTWVDEFQFKGESFTSLEMYEMQVGEEYLSIFPTPEDTRYFETEPPATEPPATEPPATEPPATEPPQSEPEPDLMGIWTYTEMADVMDKETIRQIQISANGIYYSDGYGLYGPVPFRVLEHQGYPCVLTKIEGTPIALVQINEDMLALCPQAEGDDEHTIVVDGVTYEADISADDELYLRDGAGTEEWPDAVNRETYLGSTGKTEYYIAHYCTGKTGDEDEYCSSTVKYSEYCAYHELGWFDSMDDFVVDEEGCKYYPGGELYRCSNTCYYFFIMDTRTVGGAEFRYYPNIHVLQIKTGDNRFATYYVFADGTCEYMEDISLECVEGLPGDAIETGSGFVITDNT